LADEPSSFCWNELLTHDVDRAVAFYVEVFGWTPRPDTLPGGQTYTTFLNVGKPNGAVTTPPRVAPDLPPQWGVYFNVEDTAATTERATGLGGHIHMPPTRLPGWGTLAAIADPGDVTFVAWEREPDQE
jgi:predicted enzyme related to lactoylglutathione lyase